jgi:AAA-like domain
MGRGVRIRADAIEKVQAIFRQQFFSQQDLAEKSERVKSTVYNFLNGKAVDRVTFLTICEKLGIDDWRAIAEYPTPDRSEDLAEPSSLSLSTPEIVIIPSNPIAEVEVDRISLEIPEGSVPLNSDFYIERLPQETHCLEEIGKPHALIRINAPRQMGKTSMMMRVLERAENRGDRTVYLSLEQAMENAWGNADLFLQWFCASVAIKAKHTFQQEDYASLTSLMGSTLGTQEYFESYLLPDVVVPVTIGLDSIDRLFDYPHLYTNFFSLLRSLHEAGKHKEILSKLRLVISHAADVYMPLDIHRSPFNVGISVRVSEFSRDRVELLAAKHQLNWTQQDLDRLMATIGGHPFLVRLAMFEVASGNTDLTSLIANASSRQSIFYQCHLARIETTLNHEPDLLAAMADVIRAPQGASLLPRLKAQLEGLGVVKLAGELVVPRCELYRQFFTNLV